MEYKGKLYGKVNGHVFPLEMTTDDVEQLQAENEAMKKTLRKEYEVNRELGKSDNELQANRGWWIADWIKTKFPEIIKQLNPPQGKAE